MNTSERPNFAQLKKAFLDSGYEIRLFPRRKLEELALDAPYEVKRHNRSNIMGLIIPDEGIIGLANDLTTDEKATTLLHELIHLYNDGIDEETVEEYTLDLEQEISPSQFGFLQFLVS